MHHHGNPTSPWTFSVGSQAHVGRAFVEYVATAQHFGPWRPNSVALADFAEHGSGVVLCRLWPDATKVPRGDGRWEVDGGGCYPMIIPRFPDLKKGWGLICMELSWIILKYRWLWMGMWAAPQSVSRAMTCHICHVAMLQPSYTQNITNYVWVIDRSWTRMHIQVGSLGFKQPLAANCQVRMLLVGLFVQCFHPPWGVLKNIKHTLVGGLEHWFFYFSIQLGMANHPNCYSLHHFSEG